MLLFHHELTINSLIILSSIITHTFSLFLNIFTLKHSINITNLPYYTILNQSNIYLSIQYYFHLFLIILHAFSFKTFITPKATPF